MSTLPIVFKDELQLLAFAEEFIVKNRLASLENDVNRCIPLPLAKLESTGYAPFPALMYCFSVIDLLGSLVAGNARSGKNTDNAARYMETYLDIPKDKVRLLQKIYRHKLVHLSQPKFAMLHDKQILAWKHDEDIPAKHLTIDPISGDILLPTDIGKIHCDAQYIVSISALKDDIKDSVLRSPGGYLEDLRNNSDLDQICNCYKPNIRSRDYRLITNYCSYSILHSIKIVIYAIILLLISSNHRYCQLYIKCSYRINLI